MKENSCSRYWRENMFPWEFSVMQIVCNDAQSISNKVTDCVEMQEQISNVFLQNSKTLQCMGVDETAILAGPRHVTYSLDVDISSRVGHHGRHFAFAVLGGPVEGSLQPMRDEVRCWNAEQPTHQSQGKHWTQTVKGWPPVITQVRKTRAFGEK